MIRDIETLRAEVLDWLARPALADKVNSFIAPVIADSATALNIFVTESFMTQTAAAGQNFLILPTQFCGALEFWVEKTRYHRKTWREVMDGEIGPSYAIHGERVWFYPAAKLNDVLRLEFRGIARGGVAGEGLAIDAFAQFFHRTESVVAQTVTIGDGQGRYPLLMDVVTTPLRDPDAAPALLYDDRINEIYNAARRLIERFPNLFLYGSLAGAYEYIQDEERAKYWRGRYAEQIGLAQEQLHSAKHGGEALRIQPMSRTLLRGRRR
jgi:hypothetical protein